MQIKPVFDINLPERLKSLREIASNLIWTSHPSFFELFESIDSKLFKSLKNNPVSFLKNLTPDTISLLEEDDNFIKKSEKLYHEFYSFDKIDFSDIEIAYFSPEFGIHESLEIYSGGLGILAGDHIKTSINRKIKFCGVGIFYHDGFFYQKITKSLNQTTVYSYNNPASLPLYIVNDDNGEPLIITVNLSEFELKLKILIVYYGKCPIFLLSSDTESNNNFNRDITSKLYTGDRNERLLQEIALGIGGVRALRAMSIEPAAIHLNEGHVSFSLIERAITENDISNQKFLANLELNSKSTIFTTHTPVIHGNEEFEETAVAAQMKSIYDDAIAGEIIKLGTKSPSNGMFSMTQFAIKNSGGINAVSRLHGKTANKMWESILNDGQNNHKKIDYITNGVHSESWISPEFRYLFDKYLPKGWLNKIDDKNLWVHLLTVPDEELWKTKNLARKRMIEYIKFRYTNFKPLYLDKSYIKNLDDIFSETKLTIGFARRFAVYKRADLLFRDVRRLKSIVDENRKGVQIIIAGKAHPMDVEGKAILKIVMQCIKENDLENRVFFVDNYDMAIGRMLVSGCDLWLNTPQRPMEACGTSGMKAALNGTVNFSVLDGWWDEAFNRFNGFAIGRPSLADNSEESEIIEADWIYELLEKEIVPRFYDKQGKLPPANWLKIIKESFRTIPYKFNSLRMFKEYEDKYYKPALGKTGRKL